MTRSKRLMGVCSGSTLCIEVVVFFFCNIFLYHHVIGLYYPSMKAQARVGARLLYVCIFVRWFF